MSDLRKILGLEEVETAAEKLHREVLRQIWREEDCHVCGRKYDGAENGMCRHCFTPRRKAANIGGTSTSSTTASQDWKRDQWNKMRDRWEKRFQWSQGDYGTPRPRKHVESRVIEPKQLPAAPVGEKSENSVKGDDL